jgi:hypothetical protein
MRHGCETDKDIAAYPIIGNGLSCTGEMPREFEVLSFDHISRLVYEALGACALAYT